MPVRRATRQTVENGRRSNIVTRSKQALVSGDGDRWDSPVSQEVRQALIAQKLPQPDLLDVDREHRAEQNVSWYLVTHLNVFLYASCFYIQSAAVPHLVNLLEVDTSSFAKWQTAVAVLHVAACPVYGRFGDVMGARCSLLLSHCSACLSYLALGIVQKDNAWLLLLSQVLSVFTHVGQGSQMAVTQWSSRRDRTTVLARIGFSYGLGMVAGRALSAVVTGHVGVQETTLVAALGSLLSLLLTAVFTPSCGLTQTHNDPACGPLCSVALLIAVKLIFVIPTAVLQCMQSRLAIHHFGLSAERADTMLSTLGLTSLFIHGLGVAAMSSRIGDKTLLKLAAATLTLAYLALSLIDQGNDFELLMLPMTCSLTLVHSILTSAMTKVVGQKNTGSLLGLHMTIHSIVQAFAPGLGGHLAREYGFKSVGTLGVSFNAVGLLLIPFVHLH